MITGYQSVQRPEVVGLDRPTGADELRAMVDRMIQSGVGARAALLP